MNAITPIQSLVSVETEQTLIEGIKLNHREVRAAETSAAVFAWHAGQQAQRLIDLFGWSIRRVAEETRIPKSTIHRYVSVSRMRDSHAAIQFGESIADIIGEKTQPQREASDREQRKATFGTAEAEYAIKLHRMTESTSSAEADIATRKLEQFAADHGMAGEEIIERSRQALGLNEELVRDPMDEAIDKFLVPFKARPKDDLLKLLVFCMIEHPDLIKKLTERVNA